MIANIADIASKNILPASNQQVVKYRDGQTFDIIREIIETDKVSQTDTSQFARYLKGKDLIESLSNTWHFVKQNIRYKLDPIGFQYIKTPSRTWADKYADCKSYSLFIGSLLKNLGIDFKYRFTSYLQGGDYTHVYVVVPVDKNEIIIDCVMPWFNRQKPYKRKKDYAMTEISRLSGIGAYQTKIIDLGPKDIGQIPEGEMDLLLARNRLVAEKEIVEGLRGIGSLWAEKYHDSIDMIDDSIKAVNNYINGISDDIDTDLALIARQAVSGDYSTAHQIMGIGAVNRLPFRKEKRKKLEVARNIQKKRLPKKIRENIWELPELAGDNPTVGFLKKIASKIKSAVKTVAKKAGTAVKKVAKGAGTVAKKVAQGAKTVVKAAVKVLTAPMRLLAKGIMEVSLPKAAPFFLYLFINDAKLLEKMPEKVKNKRKKAEGVANFIVDAIGMKREHFMSIVRTGIMKQYKKSPENLIAEMTKAKGIKGIGAAPGFPGGAAPGGSPEGAAPGFPGGEAPGGDEGNSGKGLSLGFIKIIIEIVTKIASLFKKKKPDVSEEDAPDNSDFQGIKDKKKAELEQETQKQPGNNFNPETGEPTPPSLPPPTVPPPTVPPPTVPPPTVPPPTVPPPTVPPKEEEETGGETEEETVKKPVKKKKLTKTQQLANEDINNNFPTGGQRSWSTL